MSVQYQYHGCKFRKYYTYTHNMGSTVHPWNKKIYIYHIPPYIYLLPVPRKGLPLSYSEGQLTTTAYMDVATQRKWVRHYHYFVCLLWYTWIPDYYCEGVNRLNWSRNELTICNVLKIEIDPRIEIVVTLIVCFPLFGSKL